MNKDRLTRALMGPIAMFAMLVAALPGVALAAPRLQDDSLVFQSEVLPSASSPGRVLTLTLVDDESATLSTDYQNGEAPIVEVGTWSADEVEQTLTVTLSGTESIDYEAPAVLVFSVQPDGTIVTIEWDEMLYGAEGLTLFAVIEEDAGAAGQEVEDDGAALAGVYLSETLPAASSPGREISLTLAEDGSAMMSTDYLNDEPAVEETGEWSENGDGTLTLTLTGSADGDYDEPVEIVFAVLDDGSLEATLYDESLYGSDGFTLSPAAEESSAAGVYVSDILPTATTPGQVVVLILYADGETQASTFYLNKQVPILEVGAWSELDSTVTVTVTGQVDLPYDEPQVLVFEREGDDLSYLALTLTRVREERVEAAAQAVAWYQSEVLPAASTPGLQRSLVLFDDGTAQLSSDFLNDEAPIVEDGAWVGNDDGTVTLSLTGRDGTEYESPVEITFELQDGGTLVSVEWDEVLYGSEGLTLAEQPLEALFGPAEAEDSAAEVSAAGDAVAEDSAAEDSAAEETIEASESTPALSDDVAELAAPFEVPFGADSVYLSDLLPAADTPGRLMRLVLFDDGSAQMVTDFLNGEEPIIELGEWEDNGDETITVTLLGLIDGTYDSPAVITFARTDAGVSAVAWDEALYGSAGLELYTEYQAE